jgi:N-acetylmuramoyl-L-alanine amidase
VLTFEDVQPLDWEYDYVQWMFCQGVISGYDTVPPCSVEGATCFKPQNNTTRGQVAKIVVKAFGFPIDVTGGPHFSDVPQGSTFYDYVETARNLGLINGYSDGTFRPSTNVTRGQLAKIAVLAAIDADPAQWTLLDPADNTFEDVVQGSTFYRYIETAVAHAVLSGYHCGSPPAGACGPENKPYFVPENNATRAQISKIVYLAVDPQLRR